MSPGQGQLQHRQFCCFKCWEEKKAFVSGQSLPWLGLFCLWQGSDSVPCARATLGPLCPPRGLSLFPKPGELLWESLWSHLRAKPEALTAMVLLQGCFKALPGKKRGVCTSPTPLRQQNPDFLGIPCEAEPLERVQKGKLSPEGNAGAWLRFQC